MCQECHFANVTKKSKGGRERHESSLFEVFRRNEVRFPYRGHALRSPRRESPTRILRSTSVSNYVYYQIVYAILHFQIHQRGRHAPNVDHNNLLQALRSICDRYLSYLTKSSFAEPQSYAKHAAMGRRMTRITFHPPSAAASLMACLLGERERERERERNQRTLHVREYGQRATVVYRGGPRER